MDGGVLAITHHMAGLPTLVARPDVWRAGRANPTRARRRLALWLLEDDIFLLTGLGGFLVGCTAFLTDCTALTDACVAASVVAVPTPSAVTAGAASLGGLVQPGRLVAARLLVRWLVIDCSVRRDRCRRPLYCLESQHRVTRQTRDLVALTDEMFAAEFPGELAAAEFLGRSKRNRCSL